LLVARSLATLASEIGGLALIAVYLRFAIAPPGMRFDQTVLVSLATGLILVGALSDSATNRLLSGRAIIYVGTISYSLYLFHFVTPSIALQSRSFASFTPTAAFFHAVNFAASFALAIALATGIYRLVEVPGRRFIRGIADRLLGIKRISSVVGSPAE
jgi:peptidoglycan/LPS O-acetylase OafA/YrhL